MKTISDVIFILNRSCNLNGVCNRTFCECCKMAFLAEDMILRGEY